MLKVNRKKETQANTKQQNHAEIRNYQQQRDTNTKDEKRESGPIKAGRKCKREHTKDRNSRKKNVKVEGLTDRTGTKNKWDEHKKKRGTHTTCDPKASQERQE